MWSVIIKFALIAIAIFHAFMPAAGSTAEAQSNTDPVDPVAIFTTSEGSDADIISRYVAIVAENPDLAVLYFEELENLMVSEERADLLPYVLLIARDLTLAHDALENPYPRFIQYFQTFSPKIHSDAQLISGTHLATLINKTRSSQEAIDLLEALDPQKKRSSAPAVLSNYYRTLANSYYFNGACNRALDHYFRALHYLEASDLTPEGQMNNYLQAVSIHHTPYALHLLKIGNCYHMLDDLDQALRFYERAKEAYSNDADERGIFSAASNIASIYRLLNKPEQALEIYLNFVDYIRETGTPLSQAQYFMNLGNVYTDLDQFYEAGESYLQSFRISQEHGFNYGIAIGQLNVGYSKYRQGMYNEALEAYQAAAPLIEEMQLRYEFRQLLYNTSRLYEAMNEFEAAFTYFNKFHELDRELLNAEYKVEAEELKVKYEIDLKDSELLLQELQIADKQNQLRMQWFMIVALLLLFSVTGFSAHIRHKNLKSLYERSRELEASQKFIRNFSISRLEQTDDDSPYEALYAQILEQLNNHNIYTQPDLSLSRLAEILSSNTTYVSRAIVTYSEMNFNNFINYHRVLEARRLILKSDSELSTDDIIVACGFNSRASFYRSFKKFTGMSPSEFARLKNQQPAGLEADISDN